MNAPVIQLEAISVTYGVGADAVRALDRVSLSLAAGAITAIVGPSGSGKTTLLCCMGGLLRPQTGRVLLRGDDLYAASAAARDAWRNRRIGFVFQQFHLLPYLNILENVLVPSLVRPFAPETRARAEHLIEELGLTSRRRHFPHELSTGERQRVGLARALLHRPGLILADEPTGNLDDDNRARVLACLTDAARAGCAVALVTHDAQIAGQAGRVLRLVAGRLEDTP